jgi:hypothetical protein
MHHGWNHSSRGYPKKALFLTPLVVRDESELAQ